MCSRRAQPLAGRPRIATLLIMAAAAMLLAGCGTATARYRGIAPLNLNDNNESTPVKVRFYQLASADKFQAATFEALWVNDKDPLGKDRLSDPVIATVLPGSANDAPVEVPLGDLDAGTHYIGVMALYRKGVADQPRILVIPVGDIGSQILDFTGYGVTFGGKPVEAPKAAQSGDADDGKHAAGAKNGR